PGGGLSLAGGADRRGDASAGPEGAAITSGGHRGAAGTAAALPAGVVAGHPGRRLPLLLPRRAPPDGGGTADADVPHPHHLPAGDPPRATSAVPDRPPQ